MLVLTGLRPGDEAHVLDKILAVLAEPYPLEAFGSVAHLSASIGLTLYPDDTADADALLRHADQAMYSAKQQGRNRWHAFDPDIDRHVRAALKAAIGYPKPCKTGSWCCTTNPKSIWLWAK